MSNTEERLEILERNERTKDIMLMIFAIIILIAIGGVILFA